MSPGGVVGCGLVVVVGGFVVVAVDVVDGLLVVDDPGDQIKLHILP